MVVCLRSGALLFCLASPAAAYDGNELLPLCESEVGTAGWSECAGFVRGVTDGMGLAMYLYHQKFIRGTFQDIPEGVDPFLKRQLRYCLPGGITTRQMVVVTTKYLLDHPEFRHRVGELLVASSCVEAFPCPLGWSLPEPAPGGDDG